MAAKKKKKGKTPKAPSQLGRNLRLLTGILLAVIALYTLRP